MVTDYHKVDHVPKDVNFTDKFASKFLVSSENSELPLLNCKDISEVLDNGPCSSSLKIFKSEPLPAAMPPEKDCSAKSTLPAIMSVDRMCESEPSRGQKPKEWQPLIDGQQVGGLKDADPLVRQPLDKTTVAGGLLSENDNEYYDYGPSMSFVIILIMANCNQLEPHNALLASLVKFCDANKKNCQPQIFDSHDGVHFRFLPEGTVDVGILWALFKAQQPSDSPQPSDAAASRRDGKIKKPSDYSFTRVTDAIKSCLKNNTSTTSSDSAFQSVEAANRHKKKLLYRLGPKGLRDLRTAYDHCCPGMAALPPSASQSRLTNARIRRKRKRAPSPMSCDSVSGDVDMRDVENGDAQTPSAEVPVVPAAPGEQQTTVLSIVTAHLPVATFKRTERAVGEIQRPGDDHFCPGPEQEVPPPPAKKLKSSAGRQRKLPSTRPM
uniref:DUF4801 domain-containing protein n=1 Tax=Macrostomum lignano TaxID=282301 RepID=A0A1I8GCX3_9PLAT